MATTEASVRAAIESFVEPYSQQTLAQAGALRALDFAPDALRVRVELGFPALGYTHSLQSALQTHLGALGITVPLTLELSRDSPAGAPPWPLLPNPPGAGRLAGADCLSPSTIPTFMFIWTAPGTLTSATRSTMY